MPPALRVESLWKCYAAGVRGCSARVWVLRGLSLVIDVGECVAIVGAPGAGKSTLAACLAGLRRPTAGRIEVGAAVEIVDLQELRKPPAQVLISRSSSSLPRSTLVFARSHGAIHAWADRVLLLHHGSLEPVALQPVRRVAERRATAAMGIARLR